MEWFENKLDEIDAAIFTGYALSYGKNPEILKGYIERWLRELLKFNEERKDNEEI